MSRIARIVEWEIVGSCFTSSKIIEEVTEIKKDGI